MKPPPVSTVQTSLRETVLKLLAFLVALVFLTSVIEAKHFLLFHTGVELFISVVTASVFAVAWNGRRYIENGFYQLLGAASLFIAIFHGLHLLAYSGLEVVGRGSDTATQLWIAIRYLTAVTFVLAPLFVARRVNMYALVAAYAGVAGLLLFSILVWRVFPICFVESQGLTPFKKTSEYIISSLFLLSMLLLWRSRNAFPRDVFQPFMAAVGVGILAEVFFTLYTDVTGAFNIAGHLLVLLSFGLIYRGLIEATLRRPYETLFRDLKRSEERYRDLVEMSPDAIIINRNNRIDFVNTSALRLFGAEQPSDLLGRPPFDLFHSDYHALLREHIALLEQGKAVPLIEEEIVQLGGSVRSVEVAASPIGEQDGRVAIQVILRDITDRKQAEEALRESEQRFRSVVESNIIGVMFADSATGVVTDANDEYLRIVGMSRQDLERGALNYRAITPPDILARQEAFTANIPLGKSIPPFEKEYVRPDGTRVPVIVGGTFLDEQRRRMVAFVLDYTEHKQAHLERDITIAFLRLVNDTTALHDLVHASVAFFSKQSGCAAVGIRLKEGDDYPYYGAKGFPADFIQTESTLCTLGNGAEIARDESGRVRLDCLCGSVVRGQYDPSLPFYTVGGTFWTNSTTELIATADAAALPSRTRNQCNVHGYESVALIALRCGDEPMGLLQLNDPRKNVFTPRAIALWERLGGYLAVAIAKARAEEALRSSAASLARSNKDLEQFAYVTSHDLQEPLRQISGFVRLLNRDYAPLFDQNAREFFDFIQEGTVRMQALINDLLQYSRVGRGQTSTDSVDLNEAVRNAIQNLHARIVETGAEIATAPLPSVRGNLTLLTQVFQNLLSNSLKFKGAERLEIAVDARSQDGEWLVRVRDNGIGFRQEHAEKIFMVFQRLHRRNAYEGTGIGLAICKRAIEEHGGRIWAESQPGQGATFYFTLPASSL